MPIFSSDLNVVFQVNLSTFQALAKMDEGFCDKDIFKDLQKKVTLMTLERARLMAKVVGLNEEIEHCHENEAFQVFKAWFL